MIDNSPKGLFDRNCAVCHGNGGEGAAGIPALRGGEVSRTFPRPEDALAWVRSGSPAAGTPYGDPGRPGGQRMAATGMPPFSPASLTDDQVRQILEYVRTLS